ncbi:MAG: hypothetical protein SPH02_05785 [Campylobacter sp.]|nr:hypothetical protein [Campylobacter sp.]
MDIQEKDYIIISLKDVICGDNFGLCVDKNSKFFELRKEINTELIKLFNILSNRTWQEAYNTSKLQNHGHEHFPINDFIENKVKEHFYKLGYNNKCDIFRFGNKQYRACGYRKENTFYLVCCDYNYSLYKH